VFVIVNCDCYQYPCYGTYISTSNIFMRVGTYQVGTVLLEYYSYFLFDPPTGITLYLELRLSTTVKYKLMDESRAAAALLSTTKREAARICQNPLQFPFFSS